MLFYWYKYLVILIVSAWLVTACSPTITPSATPQWTIGVNLYSGRQNPEGKLTAGQAQELEENLAELPSGAVQEMGGLGYQGFTVRRQGATGANDILAITVYNGIVEVTRTSGTQYLSDPDRALEKWLFEIANEWLSVGERQIIVGELGGM